MIARAKTNMLLPLTLALAACSGVRLGLQPTMLAGAPRVRVAELKRRLEAYGVPTQGIIEKEELVRLLNEKEGQAGTRAASQAAPRQAPSQPGPQATPARPGQPPIELPVAFMQGGAYAEIDAAAPTGASRLLRMLIDSGAATTILSSDAAAALGFGPPGSRGSLTSRRHPSLALPCGVASAQQQLPSGVDGILGVDCMRAYNAAELDWAAAKLRLHAQPYEASGGAAAMPMSMRRVSAGELPFVTSSFGSAGAAAPCRVEGLVDTGSPVTMVTPELAEQARVRWDTDPKEDIITTGVDGQPMRMRAATCDAVQLGVGVTHGRTVVYVGVCPMMRAVGWEGTAAALLGLDVLRSGVQAGKPAAAAAGGPRVGRMVLDFARGRLLVE